MSKRTFILRDESIRRRCQEAIWDAPEGHKVTLAEQTRTLDQNAKFHAIVEDIARSKAQWLGKPRTAPEWKVLLVSGHAVATKEGSEIVPGLEGEFVNLRESTAAMTKKRGASLIEYTLCFAAMNEIKLTEAA